MGIDTRGRDVAIGVVGLGSRSVGQIGVLLGMEDVRIAAVCDRYEDRVAEAVARIERERGTAPGGTTDYRALLSREDIEAVVILTSWQTHIPFAIEAMKAGKIVAMEVGGATSLQECWDLVRTSERTGVPVMLLENCCYGSTEMALLRMVRTGLFGELVHCQGGYLHDLRDEVGLGDINRHYRQENFLRRNGDLYPTHALGPIAKYLNLGRGNRMVSLTAMASKAAGQSQWLQRHRPDADITGRRFNQGDIVTTMVKCANGETILLTHDCTLPRAYSRGGRVQGARGLWQEDNQGIFIEGRSPVDPNHWAHQWESDAAYMDEFKHPLWQAYEAMGTRGGHGGMDYLVLRAFITCIQQGLPFPIDVYDTAAWMCVTPLSEESIALGSQPVAVPDFTSGRWMETRPVCPGPFALDEA